MSIKKFVLSVLITLILLGTYIIPVNADPGWYTCYVKGAGMGWGTVYLQLTDSAETPSFTGLWCIAQASQENKTMAVALTAQSSNQKVLVYVDPDVPQDSRTLYTIYVLAE